MSLTVNIRDTSSTLLVALTVANGYELEDLDVVGEVTHTTRVVSPWVDGDFPVHYRRGAVQKRLAVKVIGTTWVLVEQRTVALTGAINGLSQFLLEIVDGTTSRTYRCDTASVDDSYTPSDRLLLRRFVTAQITLQPNPTLTGV